MPSPKRAEKRPDSRSVTFRLAGHLYDEVAAVARARGVDVSAVLNWVLSGAVHHLKTERAAYEKELMEAIEARPWEKKEPAELLRELHDWLGKLQGEYAAMSEQVLGKGKRRAG